MTRLSVEDVSLMEPSAIMITHQTDISDNSLDCFGQAVSCRVPLAAVAVLGDVLVGGSRSHGPQRRRRYRLLQVSRAVREVARGVDTLDARPPELVHYDFVRIVKVAAQLLWELGPGVCTDLYE